VATHPIDFPQIGAHAVGAGERSTATNPYCGDVFVFRSKRMDRVKLLAWDGSGMVLVTKWLHEGRFTWPPIRDGVVHLSPTAADDAARWTHWTRASPKLVRQPFVVG